MAAGYLNILLVGARGDGERVCLDGRERRDGQEHVPAGPVRHTRQGRLRESQLQHLVAMQLDNSGLDRSEATHDQPHELVHRICPNHLQTHTHTPNNNNNKKKPTTNINKHQLKLLNGFNHPNF